MKPFPIPVVALGPGTQTEDETLDYLPMPKDMDTLPAAGAAGARRDRRLRGGARGAGQGAGPAGPGRGRPTGGQVGLLGLPAEDRQLINQVMGEGEASALVRTEGSPLELRIQESVFAGVWRT
jgi:hydrogenase-1 operon protein HyaF